MHAQLYVAVAKENVVMAERSMLYTLNFDWTVETPYTYIVQMQRRLGLMQDSPYTIIVQNAWNLVIDR
jgi:hypothetical protein